MGTTPERFEVVRVLGQGGMGVVYEAFDQQRGRRVALKMLSAFGPEAIYRIKREFRALAGVRHENLVELLELGAEDEQWFITMELVEGRTFLEHVLTEPVLGSEFPLSSGGAPAVVPREAIDELAATEIEDPDLFLDEDATEVGAPRGPAPSDERRLRSAFLQLAEGITAIHGHGRLHRDLKPSNVLVDERGRLVILDFGLATELWEQAVLRSTNTGGVLGTVAYMSPEQAAGEKLSPASDWYAAGVMLYEALTGKLPFGGQALTVLLEKQRQDPLPPSMLAQVPADLERLCMGLLSRNPRQRPNPNQIRAALGAVVPETGELSWGRPPFVGRAREMSALHRALRETVAARGGTMLVQGAPGMGRTAIIEQFVDEISAASPRPLVLLGRCYEGERLPFKAVDAVVDALVRRLLRRPGLNPLELFGPEVIALAQVFPVLHRLPGIPAGGRGSTTVGSPPEQRRRAFSSLARAFHMLAEEGPVVVVVEDLHFGDLDSARLFAALVGPPHPVPMLLLGTARLDDPVAHQIVGLVRRAADLAGLTSHRVSLGPLELDAAQQLAAALLLSTGAPEGPELRRHARRVAEEARGQPVLLREIAQLGLTPPEPGGEPLSGDDRLSRLLRTRVVALPAASRSLLETLAVATGPLPISVLLRAARLGPEGARPLRELRDARFAREGARGEDDVEIAGDRLRDTVLGQLSEQARAERHSALVAAMLEAEALVDPRVLVHHLRAAGDEGRAARVALSAAEEAFQGLAFEKAAELYRVCLELADRTSVVEWSLLQRQGDCLAHAGHGRAAAEAYLAAARTSRPERALDFERKAAEQLLISGHFAEGRAVAERVVAAVGLDFPASRGAAIRALALDRLQLRLRGLAVKEGAPEAKPKDVLRMDVCWTMATGFALFDLPRSMYFVGRLMQLALNLDAPSHLIRALAAEALLIGGAGRADRRSRQLMVALKSAAERQNDVYARALIDFSEGFTRYLQGRWAEAEKALRSALEQFETCPSAAWETDTTRLMMLEAASWQGRWRELPTPLATARGVAEDTGNLYALTTLRVCPRLAVLHLAADRPRRLEREVSEALEAWPARGYHVARLYALETSALAELYQGRADAAWARVQADWEPLERSGLFRVALIAFEAWSLRARVLLAAGAKDKSARRLFVRALSGLRTVPLATAAAEATHLDAQHLAVRGRTREAGELFAEAASQYGGLGQQLHNTLATLGRTRCTKPGRPADLSAWGIRAPERMVRALAPGVALLHERA